MAERYRNHTSKGWLRNAEDSRSIDHGPHVGGLFDDRQGYDQDSELDQEYLSANQKRCDGVDHR